MAYTSTLHKKIKQTILLLSEVVVVGKGLHETIVVENGI